MMDCVAWDYVEAHDGHDFEKLKEVEKISCILYFNSRIKDSYKDAMLNQSETLMFKTVHNINDPLLGIEYLFLRFSRDSGCHLVVYNSSTEEYNLVTESLEAPNFDWSRKLILQIEPVEGGQPTYFDFRVVEGAWEGDFAILLRVRGGKGCTDANLEENPLTIAEQDFSTYLKRLWSKLECSFHSPIFRRILDNQEIQWSGSNSSSISSELLKK